MRVEWHDSEDINNVGQFVIFPENSAERAIVRRFVEQGSNKGWKFWLHGSCYSCDLQAVTSFNFGFVKEGCK